MPRVPPVTSATAPSGADIPALLPRDDARAPHEAGAEGGEADGGAGLEQAVALGLGQRERDRRARGVRHAVDVDGELVAREAELAGGRLDDARVGLVGDEEVEV